MNIEEFREYCIVKKGVTESFPFDETTLVFKVMGKIFALTSLDTDFRISLKSDPEEAERLLEQFSCIQPAPYMSKIHWIMVTPDGTMDEDRIKNLIDRSYELVVMGLTKKLKKELQNLT